MSDEQIARPRGNPDLLASFVKLQDEAFYAESAASDVVYRLGRMAEDFESMVKERDALRAVLREIVTEHNTSITGRMNRALIERAEKLLGEKS